LKDTDLIERDITTSYQDKIIAKRQKNGLPSKKQIQTRLKKLNKYVEEWPKPEFFNEWVRVADPDITKAKAYY
jgi:hypothetical protein